MASVRISVFEYLSVSNSLTSINDQNLAKIRLNRSTSNRNVAFNDQTLRTIAQQLGLLDDPINLQHLKICLAEDDGFDVKTKLFQLYLTKSFETTEMNVAPQLNLPMKQTAETELVCEITCYIHIKKERKSVEQFIDEFLFKSLIEKQNDSVR